MPYRPHLKNVHTRDCAELLTGPGQSWELDGHRIQGYRSIDGYDYVAEVLSSDPDPWKAVCVATVWDDNFTIVPFDELFGWSGFSIHEAEYQTYYGFGEDGIINDLMHVPGPNVEEQIVDLDGNGINELVCTNERKSAYICFQRDGIILSEDVALCMKEAMPERSGSEFLFAGFDPDTLCLTMEESLPEQAENGGSHETDAWDIYFDGESLLVYERSSDAAVPPRSLNAAPTASVIGGEKSLLDIPLEDQESSRPYRYQLKNIHTRDCAELFTGPGQSVELDGRRIQGYRSIDGYAYVAEVLSSDPDPWKAEVIDTVWDEDFTIVPFDQLFGWSGFSVHEAEYQTYYGFDDEDGVVNRLITVPGPGVEAQIVDLNGDGINELVCTNEHKAAYIYFQRDGSILSEDVALLMKGAVPDKSEYDFQFAGFDPDTRCLTMEAVPPEDGGSPVSAWEVYFGKENLFVYKLSAAAAD